MVFTYEDKIIIKYLRTKYGHGAMRIVNDHPEFNWNINGMKTLLKIISYIKTMGSSFTIPAKFHAESCLSEIYI